MTPKQLQKFLARHDLTQSGAAAAVGITDRSMRRYISGDQPVPRAVEFALFWIVHSKGDDVLRRTGRA